MAAPMSWTSEFQQSFKNLKDLYFFLGWELPFEVASVAARYPLFVPRSLAIKIKNEGPEGVLAKQFLPHELELDENLNAKGLIDPIGDKTFFKAPQLIHRYSSRALFTPTSICPVHCRYCFRKNELNASEELFQKNFELTLLYLKEHPEISEIIFTGGDPFTLSNEKVSYYLESFAKIKSIKDIRFHSRYPVILPERFDHNLRSILKDFNKVFRTLSVAIHANHVNEFDEINKKTIADLKETGIQLLSQTVLLSGVNDSNNDLLNLIDLFLELKVRPYYLHHPDRVKGGMHFYISLKKGRTLYHGLRDALPGWALPAYIVDIPGGHGKVPAYNPETTHYSGQLLSRTGESILSQEPDFIV